MTPYAATKLALAFLAAFEMATWSPAEAADTRALSGSQIKAKFTGMQLTDEVHYRYVFERDGTLRSYAMGSKKIGQWSIEKNELCLWLEDKDDGCYSVMPRGERFELVPSGLGPAFDGIVEPPDPNGRGKT